MEKVRVSKLMSQQGLCSRREADGYIERGWVFVNGERVTELGTRVDPAQLFTAARLFEELVTAVDFPEFLTTRAYDHLE